MTAAAGSVRTQATTMLPATPQRTADSRLAAPDPITAPEITCGRERITEVRSREDDRRTAALRRKALCGVHLDDPRADRLDDAPAARPRAERHRGGGAHDYP